MSNIIFMARLTDQGDFAAVRRAEHMLEQYGFSVGTTQRGSSRGIMFGDRSSHAQIEIWDPAPLEAVRALADALEGQPQTVLIMRPEKALARSA